jgi:RNA polymerase sigma-70 factor (ECF subfamily)
MSSTREATRASLILRLKNADDVAAWDEFIAIYSPVIFRVTTNRGFQAADAEDIVQQVFLAVANSVSKWLEREDRGSFRAWLLRIARNEAVDILTERATRSLGRDGSVAARLLANLPERAELSSAFDLEYERRVFRWATKQVRAAVTEQTWDAFWLSSIDGLPISEVAQRLKIRPGNVYLSRSRVMSRIKELVAKFEERE